MALAVTTEIEIGVVCAFDSRRSAVTTISLSLAPAELASAAAAASADAECADPSAPTNATKATPLKAA